MISDKAEALRCPENSPLPCMTGLHARTQ